MLEEVVATGYALAGSFQPYFAILIFQREVDIKLIVLVLEPPDAQVREDCRSQETSEVHVGTI